MSTLSTILFAAYGTDEFYDTFWLPKAASTFASDVDAVYWFILILCTIFFIPMMGAMFYFAWAYRDKNDGRKPNPIHGNMTIEAVWTFVPTVLLVAIFAWSFTVWMDMQVPLGKTLDVHVVGQKWSWSYNYMDEGVVGATELVVPVDQPVKLIMYSQDVLHSYFVPAFRIKKDVVPGRYSVLWFEATEVGEYQVYCTEYCGREHSRMYSVVRVLSETDYNQWLEDQTQVVVGPTYGEELFASKGCTACHKTSEETLIGPGLGNMYNKNRKTDKGDVVADDEYLRESIVEPMAKIRDGYQPVMPAFGATLSDDQLASLIAYIKTLSGETIEDLAPEGDGGSDGGLDGAKLYEEKFCKTCHTLDGSNLVGPSFKGRYGSTIKLTDGSEQVVDDAYVLESILNPTAKTAEGQIAGAMVLPVPVNDEEAQALLDYIKTIK